MSALPDLMAHFLAMERLVEAQPEGVTAEIAHGTYAMSPRPRLRHGAAQGRLFGALHAALGTAASGGREPQWLFIVEPEIRSAGSFSRLVPDLAAWRRSTTGWPDAEEALVERIPDWVGEIISPSNAGFDRGLKKDAYGLMGVAWLWLVDPDSRSIETFSNLRGRMVPGAAFGPDDTIAAPPFESLAIPVRPLFL